MTKALRRAGDACDAGAKGEVISVDVAATKALALAQPIRQSEFVPLLEARGRILARRIDAGIELPPFDGSAMDGYAVRLADLAGDGPWLLKVNERIAAGDNRLLSSPPMSAARIFTGAHVPGGYDAVIMQEHVTREGDRLVVTDRPRRGGNIRFAGEDVRIGACVGEAGTLLTPQRLALLAAQGVASVDVLRRVRIGLLSTGSELREVGAALGPGEIYNSNRVMLNAFLGACRWAQIVDFGIVADDEAAIGDVLGRAALRCDVLITTGGVSAGEEDHVIRALTGIGAVPSVLKVAMRPGKPVKVGKVGSALFAGLPGNPNAALVTFHQIALPAIRRIAGLSETSNAWLPARAGFDYSKKLGRTEFVPAKVIGRDEQGHAIVTMLGRGSSASLWGMAEADGLATLAPDREAISPGMPLRFEPFGWT